VDLASTARSLSSAFERATRSRATCSESWFDLADHAVRFRIVGRRLAESIATPFSHLEMPAPGGKGADLTVELWDAEESTIACPLGPTPDDFPDGGVVTSSPDGSLLAHERTHSRVVLDRRARHLVGCVTSDRRLHFVERARPLNLPLAVWCGDQDIHLVHAALVARDGSGVLMAGVGGAGKSTSALLCAAAGFDFLGDDCVAIRTVANGTFEGCSLYNSVNFVPEHLARLGVRGVAAGGPSTGPNDKAVVCLAGVDAIRLGRVAPIRALALPRICETRRGTVRRASKRDALLTLAPSSIVKRAVPIRDCLRRMALLVERVPAYWLELGPDLAAIPRDVDRLLSEALAA